MRQCDKVRQSSSADAGGLQLLLKVSHSAATGTYVRISESFRNVANVHNSFRSVTLDIVELWPALGNKATKETGEQIVSLSSEIWDASSNSKRTAFDAESRQVSYTLRWPHLKAIAINTKDFHVHWSHLSWSSALLGCFSPIVVSKEGTTKAGRHETVAVHSLLLAGVNYCDGQRLTAQKTSTYD